MKKIAGFIFWLIGWKIDQTTPLGIKKCVIVVGPHTSNWDFVLGRLAFVMYGVNAKFLIKKELFFPPLSWLLKAHVEASVEFSILLSGFIVKLGILGLIRILDNFQNNYILYILLSLAILAIIDATIRLFAQQDLKRIVALTTVIEMN